jgi:hypothetical protein
MSSRSLGKTMYNAQVLNLESSNYFFRRVGVNFFSAVLTKNNAVPLTARNDEAVLYLCPTHDGENVITEPQEATTIAAIRQGNASAFERIFRLYYAPLCVLSGNDQLSYTVNQGRNQYGYTLGVGSNGAYTLKLKQALHMAIKVINLFGRKTVDPFTSEQLLDPKFDKHTLAEFAKYQALKNLKDQSGNVGPVTLRTLDHDARTYEVMNKSGQQDPTEKERLPGSTTNNQNVYQYGKVGNYTFNMSTRAGCEMYAAAQNALKYGKEYTPSKEKLNEQYIEAVGSDQLLKDSDNALRRANMVLLRVNISLANPNVDDVTKSMLTAKKQILSDAVQNMTNLLNSDDREVSGAKADQIASAKQKEAEASKALFLPTPISPIGDAVKEAAKAAAKNAGGTVAGETGGIMVSAGAVTAVAVCAVAIVAIGCLYYMLTSGGLVQLKGLIDEVTKIADDVLTFVDSPAVLPKPPLNKPADKPENKPEEKPKPQEEPKPVGTPVDDKKKNECDPVPVGRHLGGNTNHHHDIADIKPPNLADAEGRLGDWWLKGKNFDAWTGKPKSELWEVKTFQYSNPKIKGFPPIQKNTLDQDLADINTEQKIAESCGLPFIVAVTDPEYKEALKAENETLDIRVVTYP